MRWRGRRAAAGALALASALALATWARLAAVGDVVGRGEVLPTLDGDSAYHLFRIRYAVEHGFTLPTVDPGMNWPRGAPCPWADGFDLLGAALARAAGGLGHSDRTDVAAALLPVLLGLVVVWVTMDVARRVARRGRPGPRATGVALAAGVIVALLPHAVVPARYGAIDHHVAEALSMLLLAGWALARPPPAGPGLARWEVAGAGAAAFACWTFTGGPLYVALGAACVLGATLRELRPRWLGSGAPALAAGAAVALLLALPALREHHTLVSWNLPSLLQPGLVLLGAAGLAFSVAAARMMPAAGPARRAAAIAASSIALAGALALVFPHAAREFGVGLVGWVLRRDAWLAIVDEFQPLWAGGRGWTGGLAGTLGAAGVYAPAVVLAGGAWAIRRGGPRGWVFAALSVTLLGMALLQVRFGRVFAPFFAVNVALALEGAAWSVLRAARRRELVPVLTVGAAVALGVADPHLRDQLRIRPPRELPADAAAAIALRPAAGDDGGAAPGVLGPWASGHVIRLLSGRPVVVNGFGTSLDEALFWRLGRLAAFDPGEFDRLVDERRVGFVLSGAAYVGPQAFARGPGGWVLSPEAMRRFPMSPLVIAGSGVPEAGVRHLQHWMPVFASAQAVPGLAFPLPELWAYERVAGTRITGRAAPGTRAVIEVPFAERGRPHVWRAWGDAGPDGRFEVVVPLPTALARPSLQTAARAVVRISGAEIAAVEIPEEAVRRGDVIELGRPGR